MINWPVVQIQWTLAHGSATSKGKTNHARRDSQRNKWSERHFKWWQLLFMSLKSKSSVLCEKVFISTESKCDEDPKTNPRTAGSEGILEISTKRISKSVCMLMKFSFTIWGDGKMSDNSSNRCSHRWTREPNFLSSFSCSRNCRASQELNPAWWTEHSNCSISKATLKYARLTNNVPTWWRSLWIRLC